MQDIYALTTTVKGYSSGTRVELLNFTKANTVFVSVVHSKEVLEIATNDLVRLRPRHRIVEVNPNKIVDALANEAQKLGIY